jgi:hypothetical protein
MASLRALIDGTEPLEGLEDIVEPRVTASGDLTALAQEDGTEARVEH